MTTISTPINADGVVDLDPAMRLASGRLALAQAIARRVTTRAGLLARIGDDPAWGLDVRDYLGADTDDRTAFVIAAEVQAEVMLDERVRGADVSATLAAGVITLTILLADSAGPFRFVLAVSAVTVEILRSF